MNRVCRWAAILFGVGYTPWAPGTAASMTFAVLYLLSPWMQGRGYVLGLLPGVFLCVWVCGRAQKTFEEADPAQIVLDEWAGMAVALWGVPVGWGVPAALALFRILDVIKMPVIQRLEKLPGGWGIVLDDVAAGLLANLAVRLALGLGFRFF